MSKKPSSLHLLFIICAAVIVVALVSWFAIPQWQQMQGGVFILLGVVILAVLGGAKDAVDLWKNWKEVKKPAVSGGAGGGIIQRGSGVNIVGDVNTKGGDIIGSQTSHYGAAQTPRKSSRTRRKP